MTQPTPLRVKETPCCDDCVNQLHQLLRAAKEAMTDTQYQRLLRELQQQGVEW